MKKIFEIARWEYCEKIKTKAFIISIVITPILIILFAVLPHLFIGEQPESIKVIGILDEANVSFTEINNKLSHYKITDNQPAYIFINLNRKGGNFNQNKIEADKKVTSDFVYGYFILRKSNTDLFKAEFKGKDRLPEKDLARFEIAFNDLRIKHSLKLHNVDTTIISFSQNSESIQQTIIKDPVEENKNFTSLFYKALVYQILFTLMIIYSGQMLVRSLLEEKSNRLIEILISSCKPEELFAGKIIGLTAIALTQIIIWFGISLIIIGSHVIPVSSFHNIILIILYFILGFLFYSSLLVGISSMISSEIAVQQVMSYLGIILIIPIIIVIPAMQNSDSVLIKILTYFPLTLPSLMILKLNIAAASVTEIIITIAVLFLSILITIKVSAEIFKHGILYYFKKPSFSEIRRWLISK